MREKYLEIKSFFWISIFKSIYLNFSLLPFSQAIKLPIIVTKSTYIDTVSGCIQIKGDVKFAMIRIGFIHSDLMCWNELKNFIKIDGVWKVSGITNIGLGAKLIVYKNSTLITENNLAVGSNFRLIVKNKVSIDENFRAAWDVQIFDSNFHYIKDVISGQVNTKSIPIVIGKNNWIGNRSTIMAGTQLPNYFIVASNSVCNKNYKVLYNEFSLIGGIPAKLIKENVCRVLDVEEKELDKQFLSSGLDHMFTDSTPLK